ncbi:hypothetical protein [Emticicia agri]|uniref:Adhesin domain-containing protein n=1 Tax=Emticicia agri TaxID=2492393 RepID=A0A4Q5LV21_9BACT|nr:hypothetical protein [Emticicia agri]RYU93347.1 hypothetical protein EWM59_22480 [Emticicia agri]
MKKLITLLLLLGLCYSFTYAQKIIEKRMPFAANQSVDLNLKFADNIKVQYWDKAEVYVKIAVEVNGGRLNDAFTVDTKSNSEEIRIKTDFDEEMIKKGRPEDCPETKDGHRSSWSRNGDSYYVCSTINYEVYLPKKAEVSLETINGNIWISSINSTLKAKTISGFVEVNWPKGKGGNLGMKTVTGEVYSDLDIAFKNKKQKNPIVGYLLEGTVYGGGPEVRLESISNNVYVRNKN